MHAVGGQVSHGQVNTRTQAQEEVRTTEGDGSQGWGKPDPATPVMWQCAPSRFSVLLKAGRETGLCTARAK